ncbi:hypothetical protein Tco_1210007 [Tanacetum coccineum]
MSRGLRSPVDVEFASQEVDYQLCELTVRDEMRSWLLGGIFITILTSKEDLDPLNKFFPQKFNIVNIGSR